MAMWDSSGRLISEGSSIFPKTDSTETGAAQGGGSVPRLRGAGCATWAWAGFSRSEGQVAACMWYTARVNELMRLECGVSAILSLLDMNCLQWSAWMPNELSEWNPLGVKWYFPLKIPNQLFQSPASISMWKCFYEKILFQWLASHLSLRFGVLSLFAFNHNFIISNRFFESHRLYELKDLRNSL